MADRRFFRNEGAISVKGITALTSATARLSSGKPADNARMLSDVAPLDKAGAGDISFLDNTKYADAFATSKAGACFVREKYVERAPDGMILLVTEEPYYAYALAARHFYGAPTLAPEISASAHIHTSAMIGKNCRINAGVVIGENARIGERCLIDANTVIGDGVEIGDDSQIGALCTLSHCIIGKKAILHRGIHIGQDGFGFAPGHGGIIKVPQLGRVMIGDDVEIGSGTCIDRGAGPDTIIGSGSKIDNLVQIGHNVQLGRFVVIAAQCGIAGSTQIGDGAMLGGQVGLAGHLNIGAGAKLAAQAGIMTDVPAGSSFGGSPAVPIKDWHRQTIAVAGLIKKKG